ACGCPGDGATGSGQCGSPATTYCRPDNATKHPTSDCANPGFVTLNLDFRNMEYFAIKGAHCGLCLAGGECPAALACSLARGQKERGYHNGEKYCSSENLSCGVHHAVLFQAVLEKKMVGVFRVSITASSVNNDHLVYSSSTHNNRTLHVWHSSMTAIRMERENVRIYLCKRAWLQISRVQFFLGGFGPPKAREKVPS
ncbi:MAG: hypothetical protein V2I32_06075, partial [Desulforhopalus sp.]|nr:hypothetical protein [Desulforhopalus sp.]